MLANIEAGREPHEVIAQPQALPAHVGKHIAREIPKDGSQNGQEHHLAEDAQEALIPPQRDAALNARGTALLH